MERDPGDQVLRERQILDAEGLRTCGMAQEQDRTQGRAPGSDRHRDQRMRPIPAAQVRAYRIIGEPTDDLRVGDAMQFRTASDDGAGDRRRR